MKKLLSLVAICITVAVLGGVAGVASAADPKINLQALVAKRMPVLLEFGRGWCIPCKYMKPILEDMSKAYSGKALVMTVDMDANKDLVRQFKIRMMPTQVFLAADGNEVFRNEGTMEREQIAQIFGRLGAQPSMVQGSPPVPGAPQAGTPQLPVQPGQPR